VHFLISAVIPLGNYKPHLSKIEDLFKSTDLIHLIFVCDRLSNNGSDSIKRLMSKYPTREVTLIEGEFGSPGRARNAGKKLVKSNWITFWDCDDMPNVEAVFQFAQELENSERPLEVGIAQFKLLDEQSEKILMVSRQTKLLELPFNPGLWRMIIRTDKQEAVKFEDIAMGEDQLFILDLRLRNRCVAFSSEITYVYCKHSFGQLTRTQSRLNDLDSCIRMTLDRLVKAEIRDKPLALAFLMKQLITKARLSNLIHSRE
jgi:poly(ribitol-phosphate) beta-N-acetylglucosaminyltransferase